MNHAAFQRREFHASDRLRKRISASNQRTRDVRLGKSIHAVIHETQRNRKFLKHGSPTASSTKCPEDREVRPVVVSRPSSAAASEPEQPKEHAPASSEPERPRTVESIALLQVDASAKARANALAKIITPPKVAVSNSQIDRREQEEMHMGRVFQKCLARVCESPSPGSAIQRRQQMTRHAWGEQEGGPHSQLEKPQETYVKVEKWHRDMVWQQKFDFFYRQIQEEIGAAAQERPASRGAAPDLAPTSPSPDRLPRAASAPRIGGGGGRPLSSGASPSSPARVASASRFPTLRMPKGNVHVLSGPAASSTTVKESAANLLNLGVDEMRYYNGDEVLMHEDILHCSNPRLFPLRDHGRAFPLCAAPA